MKTIIIPARMDSERLPGKPLLDIGGESLLSRTFWQAKGTSADYVIVTSPDREVGLHCKEHGMAFMPSEAADCGTRRCAALVARMTRRPDVVVNWQVDEPFAPPRAVDILMSSVLAGVYEIGTLMGGVDEATLQDRDVVKVISLAGEARWFSRAPMAGAFAHCGVYAFSADALEKVGFLSRGYFAQKEGLEQLTWLEAGYHVGVELLREFPRAVNSQQDYMDILLEYKKEMGE